jgi:UDP-2,3-diacylglucosamine pyrophosphatase LpxH
MRSTLLSDAHLNALNDPRQDALVSFMRDWETDEWVFVGDILDFGWSWPTTVYWAHVPFWAAVVEARRRGQGVVWVRGNHDFGIHADSLNELGVEVVDKWSRKLGGKIVGAVHGDHSKDSARSRVFQFLTRGRGIRVVADILGPQRLYSLADFASKSSKSRHTPERLEGSLARQERLVQHHLSAGWDVCCVGHTHAPGVLQSSKGMHVNLGDWSEHRTFVTMEESLELMRWHEESAYPVEGEPRRREEWGIGPC